MGGGSRHDLTAFVLAGGKSTRMGADKAFIEYEGRSLLHRALEVAVSIAPQVYIGGSREKFAHYGAVVEDTFPDCGPLGGIHAALRASQTELNVMLAVDMPFISPQFLRYLTGLAGATEATAIVPRAEGRFQPLCAIFRRDFAEAAEAALLAGRNKIDPLFALVETRAIEEEEMEHAGFSRDIFRNVNTPQDLQEAERQLNS